MEHKCPTCHKIINAPGQEKNDGRKFFPFCSERCKLVDLGSWLDADYKIPSVQKSLENDQDFDLPE